MTSKSEKHSFMKSLFNGHIPEIYLHNFPFFNSERENEYKLFSDSIQNWLKKNIDSLKFDKEKKLPDEIIKSMKEMGLFGLIIPEEFGGSAFNQTFYTRTLELLNTWDASVTLTAGAHSSIGLKGLYLYGNQKQKEKYMPKLATGEMIASFALTEPGAGSDAAAIKTRAVKQGDYYLLNGSKLWITNGGMADFFTVFAKEEVHGEDKITAFIVTRDLGGITHGAEEQKLGIKASSTVEVYFKDVKVPLENVLGEPGDGFKIAMGILNQGRMGLAGGAIGAIRGVYNETVAYTKARKAFGHSICEFEVIQNFLTQITMDIYACESMTYLATSFVDKGNMDYSIEAAICKIFVTEASWRCLNTSMQIHGGNGYMVEYGIERKLRDARIGLIFEGTNEILRLFVAATGIKDPANGYKRFNNEIHDILKVKLDHAIERFGFLSEFVFNEVKKNVFIEHLEGFDPELEDECECLSDATKILTTLASLSIRKYGKKLLDKQLKLINIADIAIDTFLISAVLSRVNTVIQQYGGTEKNSDEIEIGKRIIKTAFHRVLQNEILFKEKSDDYIAQLSHKITSLEKYPFPIDQTKKKDSV